MFSRHFAGWQSSQCTVRQVPRPAVCDLMSCPPKALGWLPSGPLIAMPCWSPGPHLARLRRRRWRRSWPCASCWPGQEGWGGGDHASHLQDRKWAYDECRVTVASYWRLAQLLRRVRPGHDAGWAEGGAGWAGRRRRRFCTQFLMRAFPCRADDGLLVSSDWRLAQLARRVRPGCDVGQAGRR